MTSEKQFEKRLYEFHETPIDDLPDKGDFLDWWFDEVIAGGDWEYYYDSIDEAWQDFRENYDGSD